MKFDVSRFKKVKSNDKETTLLHPHGHTITLNHENIRPEMKKVLSALPMAEGGEVPEETQQTREPAGLISDPVGKVVKKAKQVVKGLLHSDQDVVNKIKNFNQHDEDYQFAANYSGEPIDLIKAQSWRESKFNPNAKSSQNAAGIMQITPATFSDIKQQIKAQYSREKEQAIKEQRPINPTIEHIYNNVTNPYNPKSSILAAGWYIKKLKDEYGFKNPDDWLKAYNMGPNAYRQVLSKGRHLPTETETYSKDILKYHRMLGPKGDQEKQYTEIPTPLKQFGEQQPVTDKQLFEQNKSYQWPWEAQQEQQYKTEAPKKAPLYQEQAPSTYEFNPEQVSSEMQPWEQAQFAPKEKEYGPSSLQSTQREPTPMPNVSPPQGVTSQAQSAPTEPTPRPNQAPANYKPAEPQPAVSRQRAAQQQPSGAMTFNQMPGISQAPQTKAQQQTGAPGGEPAGAADRFGFGALQTEMEQARAQGLQGALMPGQAYEQYAKDAQDVLRQRNQEYKALWDRTNQYKTDYQNEIKNTAAKIQQVDPTRWLHNNVKTVPQKITTAIGLLLSGMGAGGGGVNLAAKWINDQIDRDIDAQKANITTQQNLMRVYNDHFRNLTDSEQMTRAVMQEYYAGLIEQQANKLTSKVKQAEGLRAAADFRMKAAAEIQNIAQRGAMMDYTMGVMGGVNAQAPEGKIRALETVGMIPKERADKMYKDIQEYRANTSKIQEFESAFKEVARLSYEKARFANPVQFKQRIDFLRAQLLGPLSRDLAGKFTEFEAKNLENILPQYIDSDETVKFKTDKFMKMLQNIYAMPGFMPNYPELNAYGIKLSPYTQQPMRQEAPAGYMGR